MACLSAWGTDKQTDVVMISSLSKTLTLAHISTLLSYPITSDFNDSLDHGHLVFRI